MTNFDLIGGKTPDWSDRTILVVEDDFVSRMLIEAILGPTGVRLESAADGGRAVEICQNQNIDLVLMDIRVPVINGYDATRIIKQEYPDVAVIAQTAYATIDDRMLCINAGCDDYLSKPIQMNLLLNTINRHLK